MKSPLIEESQCLRSFSPEPAYSITQVLPVLLFGMIIIAGAFYINLPDFAFLGVGIGLYALYKYYYIRTIKYYLTEEQIIVQKGIISKRTDYLELFRVIDLLVLQPFWLRLFGLMHVNIISFDSNEQSLFLKGIKTTDIPNIIRKQVQECRRKNKILTVDR